MRAGGNDATPERCDADVGDGEQTVVSGVVVVDVDGSRRLILLPFRSSGGLEGPSDVAAVGREGSRGFGEEYGGGGGAATERRVGIGGGSCEEFRTATGVGVSDAFRPPPGLPLGAGGGGVSDALLPPVGLPFGGGGGGVSVFGFRPGHGLPLGGGGAGGFNKILSAHAPLAPSAPPPPGSGGSGRLVQAFVSGNCGDV